MNRTDEKRMISFYLRQIHNKDIDKTSLNEKLLARMKMQGEKITSY